MANYYFNPNNQQQPYSPFTQFQFQNQPQQTTQAQQQATPQQAFPSGFPSGAFMQPAIGAGFTTAGMREESYIENLLRLNRGKEAVFSFTIPASIGTGEDGNTIMVRGVVVEAGRDHAVIREFQTDHYYLFPMVYFDYARFEEPITYLRGGTVVNGPGRS